MAKYDFTEPYILNITNVLRQLDCPLYGTGEAWWISELLFLPGAHRFQLLEWIFTVLEFSLDHDIQSDLDKQKKEYLKAFCAMGICTKSDMALVLGEVSKSKQMKFWKRIFDIVWAKAKSFSYYYSKDSEVVSNQSNEHSDECLENEQLGIKCQTNGENANECQVNEQNIEDQQTHKCSVEGEDFTLEQKNIDINEKCLEMNCNKSISIIDNIASKLNVNDLFIENTTLFSSDVEKDVNYIISNNKMEAEKLPRIKDIKDMAITHDTEEQCSPLVHSFVDSNDSNPSLLSEELQHINNQRMEAANEFESLRNQFSEVYSELKPVLKSNDAVYSDVGLQFQQVHSKLELFSRLMHSLTLRKSTSSLLDDACEDMRKFQVTEMGLTRSDLEDYISTLQTRIKL